MTEESSEDKLIRILKKPSFNVIMETYKAWLIDLTDKTMFSTLLEKHGWTYKEFILERDNIKTND
jgi:hypothetical protein